MKKKILCFILIALYCSINTFAQITFQKSYFDAYPYTNFWPYAVAYDIKPAWDGGYIVTGNIGDSTIIGPYMMKLDINGDTVWTKHYIGSRSGGNSVLQTCDSGYISIGSGLIRGSSSGDTLWTKYYSPPAGNSGCKTNDCGFILVGSTDSIGAGGYDVYVIKTDSMGNPSWVKTYGGTGDDYANAIQQTAEGGYIISGSTNSFGGGGYLIKINANGDTLWTRTCIGVGFGPAHQTSDKGYIIMGGDSSNTYTYFIKTDSSGDVIWSKKYGLTGYDIQQTTDTGFIVIGGIAGNNEDMVFVKMDKNGNILWARDFPSSNQENIYAISILQVNDGGYIIVESIGFHMLTNAANWINFIKTDFNGLSGCNQHNITVSVSSATTTSKSTATVVASHTITATSVSMSVSNVVVSEATLCYTGLSGGRTKNPATVYPTLIAPNGSINISFNDENLTGATVTVFNIMGVALYTEVVSGKEKMVLNALKGKLSTGMYFVRIMQGDKMTVKKVVVM